MANIKEIFLDTINKGLDAAELISESKDKALAYAEIAKALATTGLVRDAVLPKDVNIEVKEDKESIKEESTKATKNQSKKKADKKKAEEKKEVKETPTEEPQQQEDVVVEEKELSWDDVAEEVDILNNFTETYGEDAINECIANFSDNVLTSIEDITPANIKAFVTYLNMLQQDTDN